MSNERISLPEVDEVRVTVIMDNSIDLLLQSTRVVHRFQMGPDWRGRALPIAEHGYSALVTVEQGGKKGTVLLDTGGSPGGVSHNFDALGIDPADIQAIVLSHGHFDHAMGLPAVIDRIADPQLQLVLHSDAYLERKAVLPNGTEIPVSAPLTNVGARPDVEIKETKGPLMLLDGMLLVSGEIARTTDFEKGFPIHYAKRNDQWEPDPLIMDDQCLIANLKDKGLVIVTGCGHAGIINIIRNARELTGVQAIHAVVGGFHLTGGLFEGIIPDTVSELQKINPRYLMPGHCTGWSAIRQIAEVLPGSFILSSVGTTLVL